VIELPWPSGKLSPNARTHYAVKMKITKAHKEIGYFAAKTKAIDLDIPHSGKIPLKIVFHPPDRRHRDIDNCLSSSKSLLDGVALALGINDSRFRPITIDFSDVPFPKGKVEVFFETLPAL